jgi:hypothetical protein
MTVMVWFSFLKHLILVFIGISSFHFPFPRTPQARPVVSGGFSPFSWDVPDVGSFRPAAAAARHFFALAAPLVEARFRSRLGFTPSSLTFSSLDAVAGRGGAGRDGQESPSRSTVEVLRDDRNVASSPDLQSLAYTVYQGTDLVRVITVFS